MKKENGKKEKKRIYGEAIEESIVRLNKKAEKEMREALREHLNENGLKTTYNPIYWYPTKLLSYDPSKYYYYIAIGSRGRGKTVSAWRWVLKRFLKYGELFIWLRLTEAPIKKASRNASTTLVPQFLLSQLGIRNIVMKGSTIYVSRVIEGELKTEIAGIMDSISTFYTTKGQDLSSFTNVVFDEINREIGERNTFDVSRAFINQIETTARMRTMRVLMLGNSIDETSDILELFNFQPTEFGIYKLTRRHAIIEYMDDSEEFKEARAKSLAGQLLKNNEEAQSSFTNKVKSYRDNIEKFDQRIHKPLFTFFIKENVSYTIYERKKKKTKKKSSSENTNDSVEGLYVGQVRGVTNEIYKLSPFLNCKGVYSPDIYNTIMQLISVNSITFESAILRSRFINALKRDRTAVR